MKHELLSPAGNLEAGFAALHYGADAVYLGLTKFSARAGAENFTPDELDEFTAYAHSLNKKVFVALNTILTTAETEELKETFKVLRKTKVDALIIQDLGVLYLVKKYLPEIELHASTQMAIHNKEGAKFLQSLGFKRVVLARELTLNEIKDIAKSCPNLDLEVFVHGALCYSYSGQCLFSALEYGKSANRGRCIYPCRSVFDKDELKNIHLFSMKDLALEEKVLEIPALSLKIEGRKKSPLYVAAVTNYYRKILDNKKKDIKLAEDIKQIFSRPWCQFHFNGKNKDITDESFVGHRGLLIGKVEKITKNRLIFKTTHSIARYDGLQIDVKGDEKPFGFGIKALYVNSKSCFEAPASSLVEVELPKDHPHLEAEQPIYLASSSKTKGKYNYSKPKPKEFQNLTPIDVTIEITPHEIWALTENTAVKETKDFSPLTDEKTFNQSIKEAFNKTGGSPFYLNNLTINNNQHLFVPVSTLNALRRKLLENIIIPEQNFDFETFTPYKKSTTPLRLNDTNFLYVTLNTTKEDLSNQDTKNLWAVLPQICRNTKKLSLIIDMLYNKGIRQFVAENYYVFEMLKDKKDIKIGAGSFLYTANPYALKTLKDIGVVWSVVALENSPENIKTLIEKSPLPIVQTITSNPPLFTSAVCIRRNKCEKCDGLKKTFNLKKDGKNYTAISEACQIKLFNNKLYQKEEISGVYATYESSQNFI